MTIPPVPALGTQRLRGGTYGRIKMTLDKISGVNLRITRGGRLVHARYVGTLSHGPHTLGWQVPRKRGFYTVELIARDPAGNAGSVDRLPRGARRRARSRRRSASPGTSG